MKSRRIIISVLVVLFALFIGTYARWWYENYKVKEALVRESEKQMEAYEEYIDIYRKDTYGGKTPQETLDLFVEALEAGDIDLASKYFMPDDSGSRKEWEDALVDAKNAGSLERTIDLVKRAKVSNDSLDPDRFATFITRDPNSELEAYIELVFNGNVWKIDSL